MTPLQRDRISRLEEMHKIMTNISDEDYYYSWIVTGVPDEPSDDDFEYIATNDEEYRDVCATFARLFVHAVMNNEVKLLY